MVMTNFQKVKTFMKSFGQEVKDKPAVPPEDIVQLRLNLINEEFIELVNATDDSTKEEKKLIDVMTDKSRIKNINELEFIEGRIYANTYQFNRDVVIIINPLNGIVEKVIDFTGIRDEVSQTPDIDVMNGIAYNNGKLFVTGKNWDKIFEVEVYSKK